MIGIIKEAFTSKGIFLNKNISLHFALQKGRESGQKLGSFSLNLEGCSNIARKLSLFLVVALSFFAFFCNFQKTSSKALDKNAKKM